MQRYANDQTIKRKAYIGRALTIVGMAIMILSVVALFAQQERYDLFFVFYSIALAGILLFQVGSILHRRWGKSPRIDEIVDMGLKGLDSRYSIFHYELGTNHALITPSGVYALIPVALDGEISYEDGKWYQKRIRRGKPRTKEIKYLESEAEHAARSLNRVLERKSQEDHPTAEPLLLFMRNDAELQADSSPIPAVHIKKIKNYLRKQDKDVTLSQEEISNLVQKLHL